MRDDAVNDLTMAVLGQQLDDNRDLAAAGDTLTNESVRVEFVNEKLEIVSRVDEKLFEAYPIVSLQDISTANIGDQEGQVKNLFKTRFSVLSI